MQIALQEAWASGISLMAVVRAVPLLPSSSPSSNPAAGPCLQLHNPQLRENTRTSSRGLPYTDDSGRARLVANACTCLTCPSLKLMVVRMLQQQQVILGARTESLGYTQVLNKVCLSGGAFCKGYWCVQGLTPVHRREGKS